MAGAMTMASPLDWQRHTHRHKRMGEADEQAGERRNYGLYVREGRQKILGLKTALACFTDRMGWYWFNRCVRSPTRQHLQSLYHNS